MKPFVATGVVERGKLKIRNRAVLDSYFSTVRDCEVTVTIEKKHAIRSAQANAYYWGVALHLLSESTGYTVDELHEWAKARFLPKAIAICDAKGDIVDDVTIGGTTTTLTRLEFYEYVERLRAFALEKLEIDIPAPDPAWREAA